MATFTTSPNMSLLIPTIGSAPWQDAATDINSSLTLIDQHDHSNGYGVKISPAGININADFPLQGNNLTLARSLRFSPQSAVLSTASDIGCLYEVTNDLYYNDGLGNQIRITQSGGIVGSPGSISGLNSPASATYVAASSTFVWQSAASTPAIMDGASYILRNLTANSKKLTLNPPAAMGADFALTLPSLPASQKILTLDNTGAMAAAYDVDNSTLTISSNTIKVSNGGITSTQLAANSVGTSQISGSAVTTAKIADSNVTTAKIADGAVTPVKQGAAISSFGTGSGSGTVSAGVTQVIPNTGVTVTTTGRPVAFVLQCVGGGTQASISTVGLALVQVRRVFNGGGQVIVSESVVQGQSMPPGCFTYIDNIVGAAGTYEYELWINAQSGNCTYNNLQAVAYQL